MSARGWVLFAAISVIWGVPYLFIKVAVDEMSPSVVAWSRLALAAAVLLPIAWKLGALRGLGQRPRGDGYDRYGTRQHETENRFECPSLRHCCSCLRYAPRSLTT